MSALTLDAKEKRPSWLATSECLIRKTSRMSPELLSNSGNCASNNTSTSLTRECLIRKTSRMSLGLLSNSGNSAKQQRINILRRQSEPYGLREPGAARPNRFRLCNTGLDTDQFKQCCGAGAGGADIILRIRSRSQNYLLNKYFLYCSQVWRLQDE